MTDKFYTSGDEDKNSALTNLSDAYRTSENFVSGTTTRLQVSTDPIIEVRPHYHRLNYEKWREGDSIPEEAPAIMRACRQAYEQVGIIRSVVDLMTELAVEGLTLESTNEPLQNFYQNWAAKVKLKDRACQFANYFSVQGNVVVRRKMAELDTAGIKRLRRKRSLLAQEPDEAEPGFIPLEYIFYDPATISLIGEELAVFSGVKQWAIVVKTEMIMKLMNVSKKDRDRLLQNVPEEIRKMFQNMSKQTSDDLGRIIIPIPSNRIYVAHNKKLDSQVWAKSFIYSILHDVIYNEKLRVAKISALDGWHNAVRLWKLGDHKEEILPHAGAFNKLASILQQHPGGILDILWDSMIEMEEYYPPIEKLEDFSENFESIMLGLGVPRILVGGSENSGVTNMFVGMKNLMKRIEGIRRAIVEWINAEVDIINRNLGFRGRPNIRFAYADLFDNQTYFKLLMDLYDRQLISDASVLEKMGENFEIQRKMAKEEDSMRTNGELAPGGGPFFQPKIPKGNQDFQKEQTELQSDLQMKAQREQFKLQEKAMKEQAKQQGVDKERADKKRGRPPGSRDRTKRVRRFRAKADALLYADDIQDKIDELVDHQYLSHHNVKNKRQLTGVQKEELERAKLEMLAAIGLRHFDTLDDVQKLLQEVDQETVNKFIDAYNSVTHNLNLPPSKLKSIKNHIFAEIFDGEDIT